MSTNITFPTPKHDCPVVCKASHLPKIIITGDETMDEAIVNKHGCLEVYLLNKLLYQFKICANYKKRIDVLEKRLASANAIIDAYEEYDGMYQ